MNKQILFGWLRKRNLSRILSLALATLFTIHSTVWAAGGFNYRTQVDHFYQAFTPDSAWDTSLNQTPDEMAKKWGDALSREQGKLFSNMFGDSERAENFDLWIRQLQRNAFFGESAIPGSKYYSNHALDVYQVLGQEVKTKEVENKISKVVRKTKPFRDGVKSAGRKALDAIFHGGSTLSSAADEAKTDAAEVEAKEVKHVPYFNYVSRKKIAVEIVDTEGQILRALSGGNEDLSFIYPNGIGADAGTRAFNQSEGGSRGLLSFRIANQNQPIHEFKNNITAIATFENYLVFIEPNHTNRDLGVVNLSFIDLDYFESALGKTVLPIFRVPIKLGADAVDRVESLALQVGKNGISVDGKEIGTDVLDFFSWMQQLTYNTTVSLVDPQYYSSTVKVLESMVEQFDKALDVTAQDMNSQMERAGIPFDLYKKFREANSAQLKVRSQLGAAGGTPREIDRTQSRLATEALRRFDRDHPVDMSAKDLAVDMLTESRLKKAQEESDKIAADLKGHLARAKSFGTQLATDKSFQATLQGYGAAMAANRKLTNRINLFWSRTIMPQPLGAPKIQNALGFVAAAVSSKNAWSNGGLKACAMGKEAVREIFATRKGRVAVEVIAGAALCTLYPAEAAQFMYHGLDVGRNLAGSFMGWMDSWGKINVTTWNASWAWLNPGLIYETYFSKDRFHKLAVGVGALYGTLLATAGTAHVLINGYHYAKAMANGDWRKYREEGLGTLATFKKSFIGYIESDRKNYYNALGRAEKKKRGQDVVVTLPNGEDFKGLFRSIQKNDFEALVSAEHNGTPFKLELTLADGRILKGEANPAGRGGAGQIRFDMDMPDGSKVTRAVTPIDGEWNLLGDDELLREGLGAEIKLANDSLVGVMQNTEWTPQEEKELAQIMSDLSKKDSKMMEKMSWIKRIPGIAMLFKSGNGNIDTLGKALKHFMFGYSSWTHSTKLFGQIWNPWFLLRNFWLKPRTWFTLMAYPNVFNRMVWNNGVATTFDGGKRPFYMSYNVAKVADFVRQFPYYAGRDSGLAQLEKFEKDIIPAEQVLHSAAMRNAFLKLTEVAVHDRDFVNLLSQGGKVHPLDPKFRALNKKMKVYFESYFVNAFESSLRLHLKRVTGIGDEAGVSDDKLKAYASQYDGSLDLNDAQADQLVRDAIRLENVDAQAQKVANDFWGGMAARVKLDHWSKVERSLNSNFNFTLNRYKTAETQMNNEEAMARATRQYVVGLVVDKPVEMLFTFLFLAGIDEGVLKPLHDEAFSENSAFYLSRYVFWNGYFVGIMISLLADVWMKIQMDARVDATGGFDDVPTADEYKKGFLSYYRKNFYASDNKWWDNQKYELTLSFVNMPAYFMTALVTNLATLGRFDLDSFIMVYKSALMPTGGLGFKLENAFEKSANYVVGGIPSKFHLDPRVQEYRNKAVGKLRLGYSFIYKTFYENPLGNLISNWMTIPTKDIGPRAFMRMWYPDQQLPTEWLVNGALRPLQVAQVPYLSKLAAGCDVLLTTNHTDAIKLRPLPGIGEGGPKLGVIPGK